MENIENEIIQLRHLIDKYKEDVEQVVLFSMNRADFEDKQQKCRDLILELRELEEKVKENKTEVEGAEDGKTNKTIL